MVKKQYALLKRLRASHIKEEDIRKDIHQIESGVRGENRLLQKLKELRLPGSYRIFSDVGLQSGEWKVQIDCLIVTDRCCIVLESKNISDDLYFNEDADEFYKVDRNGNEIAYRNPYFQLLKHIRFMKEFFRLLNLPQMNVTGAVVLTAKSCRIRQKPAHYPIFKLESIIEKIIHMYELPSSFQLSSEQLDFVEKMIWKKQSAFIHRPLCESYHISPNELIRGVECPNCSTLGMKRTGKTWTCIKCDQRSRDAHKNAVQEYFWLVSKEIRNKDFRVFCQVDSVYAASRMLNSMDLQVHRAGPKTFYTQKKDR
ncbi:nuclease-related domain-containing protein [Psychrobacillus soli]|uniref:nuclease-related domain-containing protein n=1 Tax=Psychrobacillus soli TaxID=1543965 RepID=UPI00163BDE02|nr:nuclease-related domain-containing protein [Psychrobacillus soli]